jgi:hypothetical protein
MVCISISPILGIVFIAENRLMAMDAFKHPQGNIFTTMVMENAFIAEL